MKVQLALSPPREEISVPFTRHVVSTASLTAGGSRRAFTGGGGVDEACTNAVKHALDGVSYEVLVGISGVKVSMDVVDSGSGFGQHRVSPGCA